MENYKLILPEHLNQFGYLFGGYLLQWVDECAWITATLDYPGCRLVTIGMDRVEFKKSAKQGAILRIHAERVAEGTTSVRYAAKVFRVGTGADEAAPVFSTTITFVRVDDRGMKMPLPERTQER